jgi:hypothetical protein
MTAHRKRRVLVPEHVRARVLALCQAYEEASPDRTRHGARRPIAKLLGISDGTMAELIFVGGALQEETLEKIALRIAEIETEKAS